MLTLWALWKAGVPARKDIQKSDHKLSLCGCINVVNSTNVAENQGGKAMTGTNLQRLLAIFVVAACVSSGGVSAQEAEAYYISNVDAIIQSKCIDCHVSGGQAGSTSLRFTSSASGNHGVFDSYVNSPSPGFNADRVLTKITGGAGHGGGVQVSEGSSDYEKFSQYMELLSQTQQPLVLEVSLEEPLNGDVLSGTGNLRGFAVGSEGIDRVEIWMNGEYKFDAPYGGSRDDVAGDPRFSEIEGANFSGYSLAWSYTLFNAGMNTMEAIAYDKAGNTATATSVFEVFKFHKDWIPDPDTVKLDQNSTCLLEGNEITILDALIEEQPYDIKLKWKTGSQNFGIIEIR